MRLIITLGLAIGLLVIPQVGWAQDSWLGFRGPGQANVTATEMSGDLNTDQAIAWSAELPGRGVSGPIVVDGRVIVTASTTAKQNELHVFCFSASDGQQLWHRQFWALGRCGCDPTSANAAPTPVSDGKHILAFYSSNDLVCLDLDGNLKWLRALTGDYPKAANDVGMSSSPIIHGQKVIVQLENQGESFAAAVDIETGENIWKVPRPRKASWSSPVLIPARATSPAQVILLSADRLSSLDAESGNLNWEVEGPTYPIPSPVFDSDTGLLFASIEGLSAFRLNGNQAPERLWNEQRLSPTNVSLAVEDGKLYTLNRGSVAVCAEQVSGDEVWKARIGGNHYGCPVIAGQFIYYFSQNGTARVVDRSLVEPEVISEREFDEPILGSPAADATGIYVRLQNRLVKFAGK